MNLPSLSIHRDEAMLYLSDLTSERGASKARFFLGRGFDAGDGSTFIEALGRHGFDHWPGVSIATPFGEKRVLVGPMPARMSRRPT